MDVRATRLHPDLADHGEGSIAHDLILAVRQRLDRRDGDRVAGVNAHRVEVFDRANHHAIVSAVAHDFHLELFPTEQGFIDEHLGNRRKIEPPGDDFLILLAVVSDPAALAAEGERWPHDQRESPDFLGDLASFLHRVGDARARHIEADLDHRLLEELTVLALIDGLGIGADHADAMLGQGASFEQRHRRIQRRLAAQGWQQRIGLFADDDFFHHLGRDWLDVSAVGKLRIRHDRRRVRVHEDHLITLLLEGFTCLDPRIIKLAALANDDGAGADD